MSLLQLPQRQIQQSMQSQFRLPALHVPQELRTLTSPNGTVARGRTLHHVTC